MEFDFRGVDFSWGDHIGEVTEMLFLFFFWGLERYGNERSKHDESVVAFGVEVPAFKGGIFPTHFGEGDAGVAEDLFSGSWGGLELVVPVTPHESSHSIWASSAVSHGAKNFVVGVVRVSEVLPNIGEDFFHQGFSGEALWEEVWVETGVGEEKSLGEVGKL